MQDVIDLSIYSFSHKLQIIIINRNAAPYYK